jgi:hypothetical protein
MEAADEDELVAVVRAVQASVLRHPAAAQEIYAALVAEGRRFSATPEGEAWRRKLAGSALVERGRSLLEVATLDLLEEGQERCLPSRLLEVLAIAVREGGLDAVLGRIVSDAEVG